MNYIDNDIKDFDNYIKFTAFNKFNIKILFTKKNYGDVLEKSREEIVKDFSLQDKILIPVTAVTKLDKKRGKMHKGEMSNFEKARSKITQALAWVRDSHRFMKLIFKSLLLTSSNLNCS